MTKENPQDRFEQEKYNEMRKRVEIFVSNSKQYLINAQKPNIQLTMLDVAKMICEIPESEYPIFKKVINDLFTSFQKKGGKLE